MELAAEQLLWMYQTILEIRFFEDAVRELFQQGSIPGTVHVCRGQEAIPVGVCAAMGPDDYLTGSFRGHGQLLARGTPANRLMAEILGKQTGIAKGRGGSIHLTDLSHGVLATFAIVGGGLPVAVGAGLSAKLDGRGQVSVTFFGDGAANIGAFHESLNLAAIWKLPVLFVCENNLYAEYTPLSKSTAVPDIAIRAAAYGMPGIIVDGNDVRAVYEAAKQAIGKARAGEGPTLLECKTYRHLGHSLRIDRPNYRPAEEIEAWRKRDPVPCFQQHLLASGQLDREADDEIQREVRARIDQAVRFALESPFPDPGEAAMYVFDETELSQTAWSPVCPRPAPSVS